MEGAREKMSGEEKRVTKQCNAEALIGCTGDLGNREDLGLVKQ